MDEVEGGLADGRARTEGEATGTDAVVDDLLDSLGQGAKGPAVEREEGCVVVRGTNIFLC